MKSKRLHSGKYTIHAKNSVGEDTAEFDITILGKPGRPNGPLEASDITKNGCKLKWKKPDDDGGAPVSVKFNSLTIRPYWTVSSNQGQCPYVESHGLVQGDLSWARKM